MKKLRILYVDTDRVWRGGQEQLFSLMAGIKERGHLVRLAGRPDSPLVARARDLGITTYPFRQRHELSPLGVYRLWSILGREEFDIVHINTPRPMLAAGLASLIRAVPIRVCSRRVNFPLRSYLSRFKFNWFQESVITVSMSIQRTLIEGGVDPSLIHVIYEGVDLKWIDNTKASTTGELWERPVVGTVAHLSSEKGHETLLTAASQVLTRIPRVRFVLVGEGDLMPVLIRRIEQLGIGEHVTFLGFRRDSEAVLKNFDVFCLPSLSEGLSSAILVAMASGLPVVATNVGGIPELVVDGETGLLVAPLDAASLGEALCRLLNSPELRRKMGNAGRLRVEERFALSRKLDQTELHYAELLARKGIG